MIRWVTYGLMVLLWLSAVETGAYTRDDCIRCHRQGSRESSLHISIEGFEDSVHGADLTCVDCHAGVTNEDHTIRKGAVAVSCGACHEQENGHGKGADEGDRPQCASCHTKHDIRGKADPASSVHAARLFRTCAQCHPVECGAGGYLSWLPSLQIKSHGKQDIGRVYERTNCVGCHQGQAAHGEEGSLDKQDCHRCHREKDGKSHMLGYIHARADSRKQPAVFVAGIVYQFAMGALVVGGLRALYRRFFRKRNKRK